MTVCKKCGGTGEINVPVTEHLGRVLYGTEQCDECDGTGYVKTISVGGVPCSVCNGTGEVQTNEEWFCTLPTEEKVNALLNLHEKVRQRMRTDIGGENSFYRGDYYREWLKEKHNHETD